MPEPTAVLLAVAATPSPLPVPGADGPDVATIVLTGLVTLVIGTIGAILGITIERRKAESQALVAKRIQIYDDIAPRINAIVCFYSCVGDWKRMAPQDVLAHKRAVDRTMNINHALVSASTLSAHKAFMAEFFQTWIARGQDARLRADLLFLQDEWGRQWRRSWTPRISSVQPEDRDSRRALAESQRAAYDAFLLALARDIGVKP